MHTKTKEAKPQEGFSNPDHKGGGSANVLKINTLEAAKAGARPVARKKKPDAAAIVAKLHQTLIDFPQPVTTNELQFVALTLIDCEKQIRTEFNDAGIVELATDIAANGILQPILLRPALAGRYTIIAGERRYRAAKLASLAAIPATITNADERSASAIQLAENIQREDLSLKDTACAIAELYDKLGNVQDVADCCHKSKGWVSKRLALSSGLGEYASKLLQDEITEDLETLKAVSDLEKIAPPGTNVVWALCEKIRKGQAGRTEAREKLAELKAELDPERKAAREKQRQDQEQAENTYRTQKEEERRQEAEKVRDEMKRKYLESLKTDIKKLLAHFELLPNHAIAYQLEELDTATAKKVTQHLERLHSSGIGAGLNRIMQVYVNDGYTVLEFAAFIAGLKGEPFRLAEIVQAVKGTSEYTAG